MTDIRQSPQYASYLKSQGWIVERIKNTNYFIKKLPIIGSILKLQRPEKVDLNQIEKLARRYRAFQIIIEPKLMANGQWLITNDYKLSNSPYLPTKTLQIDLTQSKEQIYANLTKNCKYSIKRGSEIFTKEYSSPKEIEIFQNAWKKSVNFSRYVPSVESLLNLKKSFPQTKSIFLTSHNIIGSIIGGVIFTRSSHYIAYYWQAFTNSEGRTSLSQYSLLYQGILWGKSQGCKIFDFEGIYDDRFPNKSWLGFTHFKRSFGGYEVEYPGCYTKLSLLSNLGRT
ncbi:MAG TPA: hypothetical protein VL401_01375 [Alphaproteobacteria bacterium]|jgi:hypothetical protein|nr:hypothetical protein [Alphaproteobacteria bacterium]